MRRKSKAVVAGIGCLLVTNFSQAANGQDAQRTLDNVWNRLSNIYMDSNFLNSEDASEVEMMLKGAVERSTSMYGADSEEVLQATIELCRLYRIQARYSELRSRQKNVVRIYGILPTEAKIRFANALLDQARDLSNHNRSIEAKVFASPVLELLKTDKTALDDANVVSKITELAQNLKNKKDYAACEPMYRTLLAAQERKGTNVLAIADLRTQLAEILKETGNAPAAIELASLALEAQDKAGLQNGSKRISTLVLLSGLQLSSGKVDEAKKLTAKIDDALSHLLYNDRNGLLNPILLLCNQYAQFNDSDSVKTLFTRSLNIADQYSYSQYDYNLREITKNLIANGKADVAESLYSEFAAWTERPNSIMDANYRSSAIAMQVKFYAETAQIEKLTASMVKLNDFDTQHKTNHLQNVQSQIEQTNNTIVLEKLYQLLAARAITSPHERRQVAYYHVKLAENYLRDQKSNQAKKEWYQITQMLEENLPQDCRDLPQEVRLVLDKYVKDKKFQDAQNLANNMTSYGFDQNILTSVSNGFTVLSRYQEGFSNNDKAIKLVERSIAVTEKYGGKQTYNYCDALTQYAALLRKTGKIQEADETDKKVTQLRAELQKCGVGRYG